MDGLFHGTLLKFMIWGVKTPIFGNLYNMAQRTFKYPKSTRKTLRNLAAPLAKLIVRMRHWQMRFSELNVKRGG